MFFSDLQSSLEELREDGARLQSEKSELECQVHSADTHLTYARSGEDAGQEVYPGASRPDIGPLSWPSARLDVHGVAHSLKT